MTGAVWPAVQITLLGGAVNLVAADGVGNVAHAGGKRRENGVEALDRLGLAANDHAITSLQAPDASAGAHIHVVDLLGSEVLCPPDIVHIIRVSPVDEDVPCLEAGQKVSDGIVNNRCRNHQPNSSWRCEFLHQLRERGGTCRLLLDQTVHNFWRPIEHYAVVAFLDEPPYHVCAPPFKTNPAKF